MQQPPLDYVGPAFLLEREKIHIAVNEKPVIQRANTVLSGVRQRRGSGMTYFIYARDGAGLVVLRRDSEEAAQRRAAELKDMGWFDIDITEEDDSGSETAAHKATGAINNQDLRARG